MPTYELSFSSQMITSSLLNEDEIKFLLDLFFSNSENYRENNLEFNPYRSQTLFNLPDAEIYADRIKSILINEGYLTKISEDPILDNIQLRDYYIRSFDNNGGSLSFHRDAKGLDISVTICLQKKFNFPLCIASKSSDSRENFLSYDLSVGESVVFDGVNCNHWRDQVKGIQGEKNIYALYRWTIN